MRFPETVTRRNLPHWYVPGAAHFVTYGKLFIESLPECRRIESAAMAAGPKRPPMPARVKKNHR